MIQQGAAHHVQPIRHVDGASVSNEECRGSGAALFLYRHGGDTKRRGVAPRTGLRIAASGDSRKGGGAHTHTHTQAMKLPTGLTYNHGNSIYNSVCGFSLHINIGRYLRGLALCTVAANRLQGVSRCHAFPSGPHAKVEPLTGARGRRTMALGYPRAFKPCEHRGHSLSCGRS